MAKFRAGLVGISGYAGMEVARILASHPAIELTMACSRAEAGKKLGDYYPFLRSLPGADVTISVYDPRAAAEKCDIVFLAVPAGTAMRMVPELLEAGLKVVDFSADYRLRDPAVYSEWYKHAHESPDLLSRAVYGLPELYAAQIATAKLVANPGCYPTASILGLYPLLKNRLISGEIIIDAKSGASGAGRKPAVPTLFCEVSDNFRAYGIPGHRHTPEIEQELANVCGENINVTFTPHLVPMKRGILATIYTRIASADMSLEDLHQACLSQWCDSPWIRVLPLGTLPETASVRGSMFCDVALVHDRRANRLLVLSAIDNLCRGASGQAIANANLMLGLHVGTGLDNLAPLS